MSRGLKTAIALAAGAVSGAVVGSGFTDILVSNGLVVKGDHVIHQTFTVIGFLVGGWLAWISRDQLMRAPPPEADERGAQLAIAPRSLAPILAVLGSVLLLAGTLIPFAPGTPTPYILVDLTAASNVWIAGAIGWWLPTAALMAVATLQLRMLQRNGVLAGMILGLAIGTFTGFGSIVLTSGTTEPGGVVGTVGGGLALFGGLLALLD